MLCQVNRVDIRWNLPNVPEPQMPSSVLRKRAITPRRRWPARISPNSSSSDHSTAVDTLGSTSTLVKTYLAKGRQKAKETVHSHMTLGLNVQ